MCRGLNSWWVVTLDCRICLLRFPGSNSLLLRALWPTTSLSRHQLLLLINTAARSLACPSSSPGPPTHSSQSRPPPLPPWKPCSPASDEPQPLHTSMDLILHLLQNPTGLQSSQAAILRYPWIGASPPHQEAKLSSDIHGLEASSPHQKASLPYSLCWDTWVSVSCISLTWIGDSPQVSQILA